MSPSKEVTRYKVYTLNGQHNRSIRFGSVLSEHENSVHVSSYVHLNKTLTHGRIQFIFEHYFNQTLMYDRATTCQSSGLKYVNVLTHNVSLPESLSYRHFKTLFMPRTKLIQTNFGFLTITSHMYKIKALCALFITS